MRRETTVEPAPPGNHRTPRPRTSVRRQSLRVTVVDECPLIVQGLRAMLRPYGPTIEVSTAQPGRATPGPVDITLYDPAHRGPSGRSTLHTLVADPPGGRVVVYSFNPPPALVSEWLTQGCAGFVDKAAPAKKLMEMITSVAARQPAAARGTKHSAPSHPRPADAWPGQAHGLSPRESEMICLITRGLTNDDICDQAALRLNTVKSYIRSAYHKIGVSRRPEAVRWGVQHGMLDPTTRYVAAAPLTTMGAPCA